MARIVVISALISSFCWPIWANKEVVGQWKFVSTRYKDQERPPPNPDLNLYFNFTTEGINTLSWTRNGLPGGCERKAKYMAAQGELIQWVVWVNPKNNGDCANDPDMQWGRQTRAVYRIQNQKLETHIMAGDEVLTYIWQREAVPMQR